MESSEASDPYSVTFSKLNSLTIFKPDRSENGKNLAKNNKILPQNTVALDLKHKNNDVYFPNTKDSVVIMIDFLLLLFLHI